MEAQAIFDYLRSNIRIVGKVTNDSNYGTARPNITIELWARNPETDKDECIASEYLSL